MRLYHYKELLKVCAINIKSNDFESSRNSIYLFLALPSVVSLGFNLLAPFSMFRGVGIKSAFGASITCFIMSFKDDMHQVA